MKMSRRARRMARQHRRGRLPGLNLVSLMDIFTILVFFLLVNSSDTSSLQGNKDLQLPLSTASAAPRETLVVSVGGGRVLLQGRAVAELGVGGEGPIAPLHAALQALAGPAQGADTGREITVRGDRAIPYRQLKRVLATCRAAGFARISLAVTQRGKGDDHPGG
jgi:biopolymer transport protein ExbD